MTTESDYIGGRFLSPEGERLASHDPARDGAIVVEIACSEARVAPAVEAAQEAQRSWAELSLDARWAHLVRFRAAIAERREVLATAIMREIGKIRSEARAEIDSLLARFDMVLGQVRSDLREGALSNHPGEALRWHPHGVVAVIGPFNFPLHLCHAHVVPALLLGNTVVVKPSEIAPLSAIEYARAADAAGLPAGVLNVVHGTARTGASLVAHRDVHALAFTGSWAVGRKILEAALDRPELLLALEMGGKNTVVVCEDADLRQAAHEIVVGGYLTTGQRCTCTDRVLAHRSLLPRLLDALRELVSSLRFGDPEDALSFAGPMATRQARERFERALLAAEQAGADVVVPGARLPGGSYRSGSIHVLPSGSHHVPGYTDVELFGPDLGIEAIEDDEEAIAVLRASEYGFANSVFTASDARFARYYREVRCGILNRNRSTNQSSPRLPFGGVGKSGNFRPAGSFAPRNLAIPVAVQTNPLLGFPVHAALRAHLPPHDLDALGRLHEREERAQMRSLIDDPRPLRVSLPRGGALPESTRWLERLYAGERVPRDKKPAVFDHLRSHGPFFVSVDQPPLSVLDTMSQTATMPFGFSPSDLVRAYADGDFGDSMLRPHDLTRGWGLDGELEGPGEEAAARYAIALRALVPGLPTVCFCASGAEANEKALALCRQNAPPGRSKVLAFEGGFHGRTMLALFATHSPTKRVPFEIAGYEVQFAPWPVWSHPGEEPHDPEGWQELCGSGDLEELRSRFAHSDDPLLRAEVSSLCAVGDVLRGGQHFAVIAEPMQSEGGDRFATARFRRGLRLITRAHGVALVMDEVQCGFGLGGRFAWHLGDGLVDRDGRPDRPDCVTFAKRAQVGVVMTRFADLEPTHAFAASLIRGRLHAGMIAESRDAARVEAALEERIPELARRWGQGKRALIANPRARGFVLAFDLPSPELLDAYTEQRFWRGAISWGAGDRTVRYRLNASYTEREIDRLLEAIHRSLAWLEAHPGERPPAWHDGAEEPDIPLPVDVIVRRASASERDVLVPAIVALEEAVYEPARRDPRARHELGFDDPDGIVVVAEQRGALVGCAIAMPLERVRELAGPDRDPFLDRGDTLYASALTVARGLQRAGLGRRLKQEQLRIAREMKRPDGAPRYRWVAGRTRVGLADHAQRLNESFGAFTIAVLENQYEGEARARYYHQPLAPLSADPAPRAPGVVDLASGLCAPLSQAPPSLLEAERAGRLAGPTIDKVTLINYVTPAIVRAMEYLGALHPDLPHLFLTSGRDETMDKAVRLMRWHRKTARVVLSLSGTYVGHTTACARSISDPTTHLGGPVHFSEWRRVGHPALIGAEACAAALRAAIDELGASSVLGIVVESIGERTGLVIAQDFVGSLAAIRAETGVPIAVVDTAGAYCRSGARQPTGRGSAHVPAAVPAAGSAPCMFASDAWTGLAPDIRAWWTGGQLGVLHVSRNMYVSTPLTFVSTWDGDELSLIQAHHQLRRARELDLEPAIQVMDRVTTELGQRLGLGAVHGRGLYRVIHAGPRASEIAEALRDRGVVLRRYPNDTLAIAPALDAATEQLEALSAAASSVGRRGPSSAGA